MEGAFSDPRQGQADHQVFLSDTMCWEFTKHGLFPNHPVLAEM